LLHELVQFFFCAFHSVISKVRSFEIGGNFLRGKCFPDSKRDKSKKDSGGRSFLKNLDSFWGEF
ncbi:MAG: hypothetical protein ACR2KZ_02580, partial [Segetibacter sp.]